MALERLWWGPSLDLLRDSRDGALWLDHCYYVLIENFQSPGPKQHVVGLVVVFLLRSKSDISSM